ncbi:hypothetical protein LL037_01300 [Clostridium estertheticum]|uniref:Gram-positive cocci surface proteins LPxTG domain-containing protein n=1 Tax=Clostridium estertheticum TaxID=238834 RepID=A0AA47EJZ9_9CLOT|nr:hypothetical protein [Clostridium estertheticum]MBU3155587.1 hypothetical protein [Clostridium estertheticum]MBU3198110.1 hypothetical protein [Clostridium estertheticum]WAG60018.1 hypothetical protein LL038_21150 [Clostridium estertheticum]WAG65902.1 hypothetical protein LL037_01300 [Clostridium estertheticum]
MTKFELRGCSFIIAIVMLFFVLPISIVNAQTKTLSDAILKTNSVKTMESNGKIILAFKAKGLSKQDQEDFEMISDMLNNLQVSFDAKTAGNSDGTISKQYVKMSANVGGNPYAGELWSDINLTGKTPIVKEIVKSPQLFEMMVSPENVNKYMLIDFDEMNKTPGIQSEIGNLDFGKMLSENKELQQSIITLFQKYSAQLGAGYNFISKDGSVYRVRIDDTQFKNLIRKVVNLTAKNEEVQNLIRDLIVTEMKNTGASTVEVNSMKADIDNMFTLLESQGFLDEFNQIMDKLKDVKILGDKGIDLAYTINENGYVIGTKGDIELVLDMPKIDKVFTQSGDAADVATEIIPTGTYTVGVHYEVNNNNINGKVNVIIPTLTSANSFSYVNMFDESTGDLIDEYIDNNGSNLGGEQISVIHTVKGGQLPNTSTHLYELLLIGTALTLLGALGLKGRKRYE